MGKSSTSVMGAHTITTCFTADPCYRLLNRFGRPPRKRVREPFMPPSRFAAAAAAVLLSLSLAACHMSHLTGLVITPGPGSETLAAAGQTAQYKAVATYQTGHAPAVLTDVTDTVTWTAANSSVATVSATGLATAVASGKTTITAESDGTVASSDITVSLPAPAVGVPPSISVIPAAVSASGKGETTQFLALGSLDRTGVLANLTSSVPWVSSNPSVATVDALGRAVALANGTSTITATANGLAASSVLTVALTPPPPIIPSALTIIPAAGGATATAIGEATQFLAIGNLGTTGVVQDVTNQVKWSSSDPSVAVIDRNGLATAVAEGVGPNVTTITAEAISTAGTLVTATSTLSATVGAAPDLPSLKVYFVGKGSGTVTSAPPGLTGSGTGPCTTGTICTGSFPLCSTVMLTAQPSPGFSFAGWSANCTEVQSSPTMASGIHTQCSVSMVTNGNVGAIFNQP